MRAITKRYARRGLVVGLVTAIVVVSLAFAACNGDDDATNGESGEPVEVDVELGEFFIRPDQIEVPAGSPLTINVTNTGDIAHDLVLANGEGTELIQSGESETIEVGPFTESLSMICTVPGHEDAGMSGEIVVEGAPANGDGDGNGGDDDSAQIDPDAEPPEGWEPRDPALAPAGEQTVHEITIEATEIMMEVAPGVTQEVWTFNNMVPGPILRGRVGDVFDITLVNNGKVGHSIDFHASKVAWNDEMRTIEPGESLTYRFEAKHSGIFMYHCGTAPTLHHIGNGMYGALVVDPPDLEPVDHEYVFVQSEFYLGPEGEPGDLRKMQNDAWDAVVFNGYHNQYLHAPIRIEPEERVRAWLLNAGPSENSSFHIVGTIFDTVYKEGAWRLRPDATQGGAQALDLQPAQGGFVEFSMDEAGLYPIVTHKFSNVGKGALGLFQAGEVEDTDASE